MYSVVHRIQFYLNVNFLVGGNITVGTVKMLESYVKVRPNIFMSDNQ